MLRKVGKWFLVGLGVLLGVGSLVGALSALSVEYGSVLSQYKWEYILAVALPVLFLISGIACLSSSWKRYVGWPLLLIGIASAVLLVKSIQWLVELHDFETMILADARNFVVMWTVYMLFGLVGGLTSLIGRGRDAAYDD